MSPLLEIKDLHISVDGKSVVKGVDLTVGKGEVHAIMGPNGSGKSTLVSTLMGHPTYDVTGGTAMLNGKNILTMPPEERAQHGLFLAFQYPKEIAGVTLRNFLYAAHRAKCAAEETKAMTVLEFQRSLASHMEALKLDPSFAERSLNKGFSGGEKKKVEILQLQMLQPKLALLDETDSGLDVDALAIVANGVNERRKSDPEFSCLTVTHYARILRYLEPDHVHIMIDGKIVKSGGKELAEELEQRGYEEHRS